MDLNEQIVRSWLEIKGFLVKGRLKFKVTKGKSPGWSDIDLIAYRLHDNKRVALDISAWMTERISLSYINNPDSKIWYRLLKISLPEAKSAIRECFGVHNDEQYETWLVLSSISKVQRQKVLEEFFKYVDRVVEFREIMQDLVNYIKENPNISQENEALQTIRALVLCELI
jgi:hypothetical protein